MRSKTCGFAARLRAPEKHLGLPTTLALAAGVVAIAGGALLVLARPARRQ